MREVRRFSIVSEPRYVIAKESRWMTYAVVWATLATGCVLGIGYPYRDPVEQLVAVFFGLLALLFILAAKPHHFVLSLDRDEELWVSRVKVFGLLPIKTKTWHLHQYQLSARPFSKEERATESSAGCLLVLLPFPFNLISAFVPSGDEKTKTRNLTLLLLSDDMGSMPVVGVTFAEQADRVLAAFQTLAPEAVSRGP